MTEGQIRMILRSSVPLIAHQWFCLCGISGCFLAALQPRREVVLWPVEPSAKLHRLGQSTGLEICIDCASAPIAKLRAQFGECQKTLHLLHHPFRFQVVRGCPAASGGSFTVKSSLFFREPFSLAKFSQPLRNRGLQPRECRHLAAK